MKSFIELKFSIEYNFEQGAMEPKIRAKSWKNCTQIFILI